MTFVQNFKILSQVVNEKSLSKISMLITYIGVRDRKKFKKNLSTLGLFSIIHLVVVILYTKFEDSSTSKCRADMMKHFIGKKEKWTNKGTDKQYVADYLLHNTTCYTQPLYPI